MCQFLGNPFLSLVFVTSLHAVGRKYLELAWCKYLSRMHLAIRVLNDIQLFMFPNEFPRTW